MFSIIYPLVFFETGPDFGRPPSFTRKKFLTVLGDSGKASSFIDNISIVKRYASESSHSIPVTCDDEALSKAIKEVLYLSYNYGLNAINNNVLTFTYVLEAITLTI